MRFHKVNKPVPPALPDPFPIRVFLVGVSVNGDEICRYDLGASLTALNQTVTLEDVTFALELS